MVLTVLAGIDLAGWRMQCKRGVLILCKLSGWMDLDRWRYPDNTWPDLRIRRSHSTPDTMMMMMVVVKHNITRAEQTIMAPPLDPGEGPTRTYS